MKREAVSHGARAKTDEGATRTARPTGIRLSRGRKRRSHAGILREHSAALRPDFVVPHSDQAYLPGGRPGLDRRDPGKAPAQLRPRYGGGAPPRTDRGRIADARGAGAPRTAADPATGVSQGPDCLLCGQHDARGRADRERVAARRYDRPRGRDAPAHSGDCWRMPLWRRFSRQRETRRGRPPACSEAFAVARTRIRILGAACACLSADIPARAQFVLPL